MKLKLNIIKKKKGLGESISDGFKSLSNKIFGTGVDKYFQAINGAIILLFVTVLYYIHKFKSSTSRYKNMKILYMYYGFLVCLTGLTISINWMYYEHIKNKKKNRISSLDVKMAYKKK
ncbi:succinate dehydrogenase subunit 4, putative [Plasmodium chabaudi chabaudi]|uniref:Succinate dehydrogenase subunit 4, putative n=1 Tax=Plasmodium chabaudi chabaudi TaxID=31271 RepID=A0A077TR32_PLACU|nr:succinate dehydrogenase subunit 4, putative [Plasmodium chabaudi chabaudi]SCM24399.1 succinate dehydrogenase subunit 4, putative [Plasmodium chabaudi chabaudi]SCN61837.1 succinate dehydrogenase subunit 4, putative [Plasmodium chabaudi chabaudi]VTZ69565.1 succinate dehydrogenase subunit 4, putative [Plasmodium chabaudi chabaudi]|eukprot:XP_016654186.1 succinate dehydrogenase subunit 4, putative [Plasmodium chabaudi chabaudi]